MSVKFDVTKRIEWLKKRMTITELDEEYIRLQIMEAMMEALEKGQSLPIDSVVGSYNLKVGDKIKMPSGLRAEVIKTKVKVKDEFGGEYYLSDIEVG